MKHMEAERQSGLTNQSCGSNSENTGCEIQSDHDMTDADEQKEIKTKQDSRQNGIKKSLIRTESGVAATRPHINDRRGQLPMTLKMTIIREYPRQVYLTFIITWLIL